MAHVEGDDGTVVLWCAVELHLWYLGEALYGVVDQALFVSCDVVKADL